MSSLPLQRIAARMETCDHKKSVAGERKKQRVRKPSYKGASHVLEDGWELLWLVLKRCVKPSIASRNAALVRRLRVRTNPAR